MICTHTFESFAALKMGSYPQKVTSVLDGLYRLEIMKR